MPISDTNISFQIFHSEGSTIRLELTEREFNLIREVLREIRRTVEPWELPAVTGWAAEDIDGFQEEIAKFAQEKGIDL